MAAIRGIPEKKEYADSMVSSTFWASIGIVIVLAILTFILSFFLGNIFHIEKDKQLISMLTFYVIFIVFAINFISISFDSFLYANDAYYQKNLIVAGGTVLYTILVVIAFLKQGTILTLAVIYLVVAFIQFAMLFLLLYRKWQFIPHLKAFNFNIIKGMFRPSLGYFIMSLSAFAIYRSDNFLIAYFISTEALAVYFIAFRLVDQVMRLIWNASDMLLPSISSSYFSGNIPVLRSTFTKMFFMTIGLASIAAAGLYLLAPWFIKIWVGEENLIELPVINVFIVTMFFCAITHSAGVFISAIGKHKPVVWFSCFEAILNIGISLLLIEKYGYLGIAIGTLAAHLLTTGWFVPMLSFKHLKVFSSRRT